MTLNSPTVLRYAAPAAKWTDALPLGNGRLGAMCFGGIVVDRFQLNEDSCWSGTPASGDDQRRGSRPGPVVLAEARRLLDEDDVPGAERVIKDLQRGHSQSYQPVGDLLIRDDDPAPTEVRYVRSLDLDTAVASHRWQSADRAFDQTAFISRPAEVMAVARAAVGAAPINVTVELVPTHPDGPIVADGDGIRMTQFLPTDVYPPHEPVIEPIHFDAEAGMVVTSLRVRTDGEIAVSGTTLTVRGARALVVLLSTVTDIDPERGRPHGDEDRLVAVNDARLTAAASRGQVGLYADHIEDHQGLFRRASLELPAPSEATELHADVRVSRNADRDDDPALAALAFNYGRYLMIAGSRPGTAPLNLQGIWNDDPRPPWSSNYTTNINVEMNYWMAEPANLAECAEPLHRWMGRLARNGAHAARELYGMRGWVAHHNSDLWGFALPAGQGDGDPSWAFWPLGGAWLTLNLWEAWAFTEDRAVLVETWPLLRGAAEFGLDWLVELPDGSLGTSPSTSPENTYLLPDGAPAALDRTTTSDATLLRSLFAHTLEAADLLGIELPEFRRRLADALARLPQPRVGADGRLAEWSTDARDAEPLHRHQSHLVGIFPGDGIDVDHRPDLAEAARRTLEARGPRSTGWSLAWRLALHARLGDADEAAAAIAAFLAPVPDDAPDEPSVTAPAGVYRNLFCAHPPFQIDGNFGFVAGVIELLLQSHRGRIDLLPCLPPGWESGRVRGLRARPGVTVSIEWADGSLVRAELVSDKTRTLPVRSAGVTRDVDLPAGLPVLLGPDLQPR